MIRLLGPADAAAWRDIRLEMLQTEPHAFGSLYSDWRARPLDDFADWLGRVQMFGAFDADHLAATTGWYPMSSPSEAHRGHLISVYSRPDQRGRGLTDALIQAIIADARGVVVQLELTVNAQSIATQRVYARNGFVQTGTLPRGLCHAGVYVDEITMLPKLDSA